MMVDQRLANGSNGPVGVMVIGVWEQWYSVIVFREQL